MKSLSVTLLSLTFVSLLFSLAAKAEVSFKDSNAQLLGLYLSDDNACPQQLKVCDNAVVETDETGRLWVNFGRSDSKGIPARMLALPKGTEINNAYLFNTFTLPAQCDFPNCELVKRISGVLYSKRVDGVDVIRLRVTVYVEDATYDPKPNEAGRPYKFEMQKRL